MTHKILSYSFPHNMNEKLFWLNRYWQHPLVVKCSDKVACREYVKECGFEHILNEFYGVYDNENEIDFSVLPDSFVLKTNNSGASCFVTICKDKNKTDVEELRATMKKALEAKQPGLYVADYQYQYIKPQIIAEKFITSDKNNKYEIQFFCFNGKVKHVLLRNDLGDKALFPFAISYTPTWERVKERKDEVLNITVERPKYLDKMITIAEKLSQPFPHVRVDLYYVDDVIIFGELTFTTSGKVLYNYEENVLKQWGGELQLPNKLKQKWVDYFPIYK